MNPQHVMSDFLIETMCGTGWVDSTYENIYYIAKDDGLTAAVDKVEELKVIAKYIIEVGSAKV